MKNESPLTQLQPQSLSNDYIVDYEKHDASRKSNPLPDLKLWFLISSWCLSLRMIGGTIGTGLFIGSGTAVADAGPVGALIAYIFVGTIVYSVMSSLAEMATYILIPGGFTSYAARLIDPSLGFVDLLVFLGIDFCP